MECVSAYIYISCFKEEGISETICEAIQNDKYISLTYKLNSSDCLFDFSELANTIVLKIDKAFFEKYDEPFDIIASRQTICCNTQSKLFELVNCNLTGIARKMYLESIILYLLFQVQKNSLIFSLNCDSCSFINRPVEMDKILKAKDYIINNLENNITIPILATYSGTNQCYLKKGFKEVVGQTIFEFLQENRMVKAKHLLSSTSLSIAEIAQNVGYASTSSFSQTYKNYFGISPSLEQKQ